jgi:Restriction Enzyme Adenine Methylase Associated
MALFEVTEGHGVVPFRQLRGGAELYESELEELLWDNLDAFSGESLFRVARQPQIGGGRPDIVALDASARVVVIEIKRDVDRRQLAQCLEYAGWARSTNLDELAGIYHRGPDAFFGDWQGFTESPQPMVIDHPPRVLLIAREFHGRTGAAFEFLVENGLPVELIEISVYEDQAGRRFVDVGVETTEARDETVPTAAEPSPRVHRLIGGRRIRLVDLLDAGLLDPGQQLVWERPRLGQTYEASITENGSIRLPNGHVFSSPSAAATEAAGIPAYDGWYAWKADGALLNDLRDRLVEVVERDESG